MHLLLLCLLLSLQFPRSATAEEVWSCLCSSGALLGTFCSTWCLLLSGKCCGSGWANIIRPPARPAPGLFQWKLGVPEDFLSSSPASMLQGCWEFTPEIIQQLPTSAGPGCALWPDGRVREAAQPCTNPIPAHVLLFAGGPRQGNDFPGIACGPTVVPPAGNGQLVLLASLCCSCSKAQSNTKRRILLSRPAGKQL